MPGENADLLIKLICFPELDGDDSRLSDSLYTHPNRIDDSVLDPVGRLFQKASDDRLAKIGSGDWDWNASITTAAPLAKSEGDYAGGDFLSGCDRHNLKKAVAHTEEKQIDGETWIYAFDTKGQLVDAKVLVGV